MIDPILAVVVRHGRAGEASDTEPPEASLLRAVERQSLRPAEVRTVELPAGSSLGASLEAARDASGRLPSDAWIWLLDSTGVPGRNTLAELAAVASAAHPDQPPIGIVGAKQITTAGELLNVGLSVTRAGRPLPGVEHEEVDQGQRDHHSQVLAVSRQGMLIREDLLDRLATSDPTFTGVMAELDLGRRAVRAGFQVRVAPAAVITRTPAAGTREGHPIDATPAGGEALPPRTRGEITHFRLTGEPAWKLPWIGLVTLFGALGRIVLGIAAADTPRGLRAAASAVAALFAWPRIRRGRALQPPATREARERLHSLIASPHDARRYHRDRWSESRRLDHDETVPDSPTDRARRDHPCHAAAGPRAPGAGSPNLWAAPVIGGITVIGVVALLSLFGARQATSSALPAMPHSVGALVRALVGSWRDVGLGQTGAADPILQVLTVVAIPLGGGNPATATKVLLLLAPGLAAAAGWWVAASLRVAQRWRVVSALAWAATPGFLLSVSTGRLGPALAHPALAATAAALICALGSPHRRASWAWAGLGGLTAWVACAAAPVLAVPLLVLLGGVAVWSRRPHPWVMFVPAGLAVLPMYLTRPAAVFVEPGTPASAGRFTAWMSVLGWPEGPGSWATGGERMVAWGTGAVPLLLALAAPAVSAVAGRRGSATARWALLAALLGMLTAAITAAQPVGLNPVGTGMQITYGWPGPGVSLTVLGLLLAGLVSVPGGRALGALPSRWRRPALRAGAAGLALVAVLPSLFGLLGWTWTMREQRPSGTLTTSGPVLPAAAAAMANSTDHTRVLVVRTTSAGSDTGSGELELAKVRPRLSLVRGEGPRLDQTAATVTQDQLHRNRSGSPDTATAALDQAFVDVVLGHAAVDVALRPFGIGSVVVSAGPGSDVLAARLSGTAGLLEVGQVGGMRAFRVEAPSRAGVNAPDRPAALRLAPGSDAPGDASATGGSALPWRETRWGSVITEVPRRSATSQLLISFRADGRWDAELAGKDLERVTVDGWQQAFVLPAGAGGEVRLRHRDPLTAAWLVVLAVSLACVTLLALPLRGTRG